MKLKNFWANFFWPTTFLLISLLSSVKAAQEPQRNLCEEASQLITEMRENGEEIAPGFSRFVKNCETNNE